MSGRADGAGTSDSADQRQLTWYERVQRTGRRHQRRADRHTVLAAGVALAIVLSLNLGTTPPTPEVVPDEEAIFTAAMVGDLMFGRHVEEITRRRGHDWLLQYAEPYFAASDYVTGNFEHPVVLGDPDDYPEADKLIHLSAPPQSVDALARAGFTNVNLANNHTMDFGEPGLEDSFAAFAEADLPLVGVGTSREDALEVLYQDVAGLRVATLGFTDSHVRGFTAEAFRGGVLPAEPEVFIPLVQEASFGADLTIVHMHWGFEYDTRPHPRQVAFGRALIDAGADIVVGHHPHVLMPVEIYNDGIIMYSLGNFVFDQGWTRTRETALAQYKLYPDGTARVEFVPFWIREAQPRPVSGIASRWREHRIVRALSKAPGEGEPVREDGRLVFEVDHSDVVETLQVDSSGR